MLQSIKHTPKWFFSAALRPYIFVVGLRYRLHSMTSSGRPLPEHILKGLSPQDDAFRHLSFTFSVIALSARVACANGSLTRDKYVAFRESFPLKGGVCGKIRSLFALACSNQTPFEHYALQIKCLYPQQTELFLSLMERLFIIAAADGSLSRAEEQLLESIAHILEISPASYAEMRRRFDRPSRAHEVMGVDSGVKAGTLKKRYHELMRRYHPDRFAGHELSPELQLLLKLKASEINAAYHALSKRLA